MRSLFKVSCNQSYACFVYLWRDMMVSCFSGQKPENPLMLLGQYSDEEVEEDSSKDINHDNRESSPAAPVEQVCFLITGSLVINV